MEFFTVSNEKRPMRLSESTRRFAYDSLNHVYGADTQQVYAVKLDNIEGFESKSLLEKYDIAISEIVKQARIRLVPGEMLSGAATFGLAVFHYVPATYKGERVVESLSHVTLNFEKVLREGIDAMEAEAAQTMKKPDLTERQRAFLASALNCFEGMRIWHSRYLEALKECPDMKDNYENLLRVPFKPATSFYEAVQSLWFTFAFTRLCGNWPGIGRVDKMLGDYLKKDLSEGEITLEKAREIIAHFLIKGCEWIRGEECVSGDAQHYQNLVLAGTDENGQEITNEVTYLILDVLEELNISDFPTSVRIHAASDEKLLRKVAQVMKHGGGVMAVYNEDLVISSLTKHGYALEEARKFANDGCWEVQVPGKTRFRYRPFDALQLLLIDTLQLNAEPRHFDSMDEIKQEYLKAVKSTVAEIVQSIIESRLYKDENGTWRYKQTIPCTVLSLFEDDCIKRAASYEEGGTVYDVISPHIGGAADVGNSLLAIDRLCFQEKRLSFDELMQILKNNWDGEEALRQYVLNRFTYYGNDDDAADIYTKEVVDEFANIVLEYKDKYPIIFVPGVSTFGRQIGWRNERTASPHGHRRGDVLAPNMSATPGSDLAGATAMIRSYCKLNLIDQVNGAALDLKLLPSSVKGEDGTDALVSLMRGFVALGGYFMQPDVVNNDILRLAQQHPEEYQSLSVRVSGWNARFVTLNKEWQDMCIEKTTHGAI